MAVRLSFLFFGCIVLPSQCWHIHAILQIINVLLITSVNSLCLIYWNAMNLSHIPCFQITLKPFIYHRKIINHQAHCFCVHFIACSSSKDCHRSSFFHRFNKKNSLPKLNFILVKNTFQHIYCVYLDNMHTIQRSLLLCKFDNTSTSIQYNIRKTIKA